MLPDLLKHRVVALGEFTTGGSYFQLRVEGGEKCRNEVLKTVEHTHCAHQGCRGKRYAYHGNNADDVYGIVSLLRKEVAASHEG